MAGLLFEDIFEVLVVDPDGKRFDKVSRFKCRGDLYEMDLTLDVNNDIYPLEKNAKFSLALASTLNLDNTPLEPSYNAKMQDTSTKTLMDAYEYVMYGKIFKYKDSSKGGHIKVEVYISFGGLLMQLIGDPKKLETLEVDNNVYLLMRKV